MPRQLPLSALRAFEAASRTGSFRAAAEDLGLTPSAISHALRGFEKQLGAALFVRDGRAIRLTPEGQTLMRHVERGFGELQLGIGSIVGRGPQMLRLHCAPSFAAQWLVPRLRGLLAERRESWTYASLRTRTIRALLTTNSTPISSMASRPPAFMALGPNQAVFVLPLGTEVVTPLCAPALAEGIRCARALLRQTLIESDKKKCAGQHGSRPTG